MIPQYRIWVTVLSLEPFVNAVVVSKSGKPELVSVRYLSVLRPALIDDPLTLSGDWCGMDTEISPKDFPHTNRLCHFFHSLKVYEYSQALRKWQ